MTTRHKSLFRDYIRQLLGDQDKLLFLDDELDGYIERYTDAQPTTQTITCYSLKYKVNAGCHLDYPVRAISLISGYDANGVYVIDEVGGVILFDDADPLNTAVDPVDGTQITIKYWSVCVPELMSELFMVLSSNHAKLTASQSIAGASMDLTQLSKAFYDSAVRWKAECCG